MYVGVGRKRRIQVCGGECEESVMRESVCESVGCTSSE